MKCNVLIVCVWVAAAMIARAEIRLPVAEFADSECATNFPVNRADVNCFDLKFRFDGTPSNCYEFAFGIDANTNGVLEAGEIDARYGWRGGRFFAENVRTWERVLSTVEFSSLGFAVDLHFDITTSQQLPLRVNVTGENCAAFAQLAAQVPAEWLWRREWNLLRVSRRGVEEPSDWLECSASKYGFVVLLR